jgi:hypothetical protein
MSDGPTAQSLKQRDGLSGTFTVARDVTTAGPVLVVTATSATAKRALLDLQLVEQRIPARVQQLQDLQSIPGKAQLTADININRPDHAQRQLKSQLRAILVAFAVGIFVTVLAASLTDGLLYLRRSRTEGGTPDDDTAAADRPLPLNRHRRRAGDAQPPRKITGRSEDEGPNGTQRHGQA